MPWCAIDSKMWVDLLSLDQMLLFALCSLNYPTAGFCHLMTGNLPNVSFVLSLLFYCFVINRVVLFSQNLAISNYPGHYYSSEEETVSPGFIMHFDCCEIGMWICSLKSESCIERNDCKEVQNYLEIWIRRNCSIRLSYMTGAVKDEKLFSIWWYVMSYFSLHFRQFRMKNLI